MPPRKKNSKLHAPKSPLIFAESPKSIPHGFLSPIQCCAFPVCAQSTVAHDCDFLWVSPQFADLNDGPLRLRKKKKPKLFAETENAITQKKYEPLKFTGGSAKEPRSSSPGMSSFSHSVVLRSKKKRTAFQDCQPIIRVQNSSQDENSTDSCVRSDMGHTLKATPSPSYLRSLFESSPQHNPDLGNVFVPDTPERDYGLTLREKQMRNLKIRTKAKISIQKSI